MLAYYFDRGLFLKGLSSLITPVFTSFVRGILRSFFVLPTPAASQVCTRASNSPMLLPLAKGSELAGGRWSPLSHPLRKRLHTLLLEPPFLSVRAVPFGTQKVVPWKSSVAPHLQDLVRSKAVS